MDLFKVLLGIVIFFLSRELKIPAKKLTFLALILFNLNFFLGAIVDINILLQLGTIANIVAIAISLSLVFYKKSGFQTKSNRVLYFGYLIFIIIQLTHNIIQFYFIPVKMDESTESALNSWGLVVSFIFVFNYHSKNIIEFIDTPPFKKVIFFSSALFIICMVAVKLKLLPGNTGKVALSAGGIGLKNLSTNETALFAICSIIYLMHFLQTANKKLIYIVFILANIAVIALTQSRVGIITAGIISVIYIYNIVKSKGVAAFLGLAALLAVLSPLFSKFVEIVNQRNSVDEVGRLRYSILAQKLGTTLSGRLLIWQGYWDQFFIAVDKAIYKFFVGDGFAELPQMYTSSFIPKVEEVLGNVKFYPLHSDLLLVFITGGIISLIIWFANYAYVLINAFKNYSYVSLAFCIILFAFSFIDMLSYSPYTSLLIGIGLSYSLSKKKIFYLKLKVN